MNCFTLSIDRNESLAVRAQAESLDGIVRYVTSDFTGCFACSIVCYFARRLTDGIPENGGIHFRKSWLRKIGRIAADASRNHNSCGRKDNSFALARPDVDGEEAHSRYTLRRQKSLFTLQASFRKCLSSPGRRFFALI